MTAATTETAASQPRPYEVLTKADIAHFLEHGWLKLSGCFNPADAEPLIATVWTRLGMDPHDPSTWHTERTNMPTHRWFPVKDFAPRAWSAICDLLGGDERIDPAKKTWGDGLIVNLGTPEGAGREVPGNELKGWHVDGDFFVHYLDSPEQALLVIPLLTDIKPGGGGTMLCPAAIPEIARHLRDHPEGVSPRMTPRALNPTFATEPNRLAFFNRIAATFPPSAFVEATGQVGDVYLLHPLMLHSASNNAARTLRIITNPPVALREPFNFDRADPADYSVVEQATLRALGVERLSGWKITREREEVVPERVRIQREMKQRELERLALEGQVKMMEARERGMEVVSEA
ncbi:hypothetical protein PENSPDRAFT_590446 [Peniophora sp. CONT]|nr:hypothetical protein PENSPDRAFT_590446 [Peniophora sp. CONT]